MKNQNYAEKITVSGAGPAGLFAAKKLAQSNIEVALINRDIKPGGLAEYGIYYDKYKMKDGLRKQFSEILEMPNIHYFGNVTIGTKSAVKLEGLRDLGFSAILVTVGAQGTKWLGLCGEELEGVYHAKDIVYHYNKLPPFSSKEFSIGEKIALIGVGNVMMDIAHWLIRDLKVSEVIAVARRGPAEVKFSKQEMTFIGRNLDIDSLITEINRVAPYMKAVNQSPEDAKKFVLSALPKALEPISDTIFRFEFLSSPSRIIGTPEGKVCGLEVEDTALFLNNGDTKVKKLGTNRILGVDNVIFCIGDRVDDEFGLSVEWNEYVKNPHPQFPIDGLSYEAYDKTKEEPIPDIFIAGWAREASSGLVGAARKDGSNGAESMLQYLETLEPKKTQTAAINNLKDYLSEKNIKYVSKEEINRLEQVERENAIRLGLKEYKMKTNQEILEAIS